MGGENMKNESLNISEEELWNPEPGDILVADEKRLLIVSVESFQNYFNNFLGDGTPIEFLLVNVDTGEMEAAIDKEDLEILWRIYNIKKIIKRKR